MHDDVIKWKHFPRYWPFVRGIHRSPVNSQHKGQWRGALMFSLICAWINRWVNNGEAGDLRRKHVHYDVIVMVIQCHPSIKHELYPIRKSKDYVYGIWVYKVLGIWKGYYRVKNHYRHRMLCPLRRAWRGRDTETLSVLLTHVKEISRPPGNSPHKEPAKLELFCC